MRERGGEGERKREEGREGGREKGREREEGRGEIARERERGRDAYFLHLHLVEIDQRDDLEPCTAQHSSQVLCVVLWRVQPQSRLAIVLISNQ